MKKKCILAGCINQRAQAGGRMADYCSQECSELDQRKGAIIKDQRNIY